MRANGAFTATHAQGAPLCPETLNTNRARPPFAPHSSTTCRLTTGLRFCLVSLGHAAANDCQCRATMAKRGESAHSGARNGPRCLAPRRSMMAEAELLRGLTGLLTCTHEHASMRIRTRRQTHEQQRLGSSARASGFCSVLFSLRGPMSNAGWCVQEVTWNITGSRQQRSKVARRGWRWVTCVMTEGISAATQMDASQAGLLHQM